MSSTSRRSRSKAKGRKEQGKKEGTVEEVEEEVKKVEKAISREVKKAEKAVELRRAKPKALPPRPSGHVPQAMVWARHGSGVITRPGSGFSLGELSGGGLAPSLAARWGVRIDARRRSTLDGNVSSLKAWHATRAGPKVEPEMKELEKELEMVGKGVKKEVVAIEKEVVKAEKAVKKEGKKVEKTVKKKANRKAQPKKRP